jgi:hypothetical protein
MGKWRRGLVAIAEMRLAEAEPRSLQRGRG